MKLKEKVLFANTFDTPLGHMVAIGDEEALYLLDFADKTCAFGVMDGKTEPIQAIEKELKHYFAGTIDEFTTPVCFSGTPFQISVWRALQTIPYGKSCAYSDIAKQIGKPKAVRAVASAIGANKLSIIIPCHRVISRDGTLGGYAGGVHRKKWLLHRENQENIKEQ